MDHKFKALIFDLDGTLVDSAAIVEQVMRKWCNENDIDFSAIQDTAYSSRTEDTVRSVAPKLDAKREAEKIEEMERDGLTDLREIEGASNFLIQVPKGRWAVATSSDTSTAKAKLAATRMPLPNVLIGADGVQNGKPHPEAYVVASKGLGCSPSDCLAFEDAETGMLSALKAGCYVIVVRAKCQLSDSKIVGCIEDFNEIQLALSKDFSMKIEIQSKIEPIV
jgi:sugar-phosphatase